MEKIKFIDLFAGIGGLRTSFEQACQEFQLDSKCVLTSEIKEHALKVLHDNFYHEKLVGDITSVKNEDIPEFDFLLAGFPCQPFSSAGSKKGFGDTRGTLFFEIERILKEKRPWGFILENVEGLVKHDLQSKDNEIGRTLFTILESLKSIGYHVSWKVLDSKYFGLPQSRKRIYIVGTLPIELSLDGFPTIKKKLADILEKNLPVMQTPFTEMLLRHFDVSELHGKSIKDKRGGKNNIHSWDIGLKGEVTKEQKQVLELLFKERRKKRWAEEKGITWMDGMPLTLDEIKTFFDVDNLKEILDDLVEKGYLKYEYPKEQIEIILENGNKIYRREPAVHLEKGYNIVTGKLSFEINKILDPYDVAPTLVATDVARLAVVDGNGLRRLTLTEGLRLFGFPDGFQLNVSETDGFDLLGNTVAVPVVREISKRLLATYINYLKSQKSLLHNI